MLWYFSGLLYCILLQTKPRVCRIRLYMLTVPSSPDPEMFDDVFCVRDLMMD